MGRKPNQSPQMDLFDEPKTKSLRDWGREKVIQRQNEEWSRTVIAHIMMMPHDWRGITEDVRENFHLRHPELRPSHSNAWGAMITKAVKAGLLRETGVWRTSRSVKSRGSRYPEYVR